MTTTENTNEVNPTASTTETTAATKVVTKIPREQVTQEMIAKRFYADSEGWLYLNEDTKLGRKGDFAGSIRAADGYYSVVFAGVNYSGSMLVHFLQNGMWPERKVSEAPAKKSGPHVPRTVPVITEEQREAAKKLLAEKKAALKAKKEAAKTATAEPAKQETPVASTTKQEDADF